MAHVLFFESMFMTVVCDIQDQFRKRTEAYESVNGSRILVQKAGELRTSRTAGSEALHVDLASGPHPGATESESLRWGLDEHPLGSYEKFGLGDDPVTLNLRALTHGIWTGPWCCWPWQTHHKVLFFTSQSGLYAMLTGTREVTRMRDVSLL